MARRYPCPQCAKEMLLEKVHEGFEVPCPACGQRFMVPVGLTDGAAPAAQATPATAPRTMPPPVPGGRVLPPVTPNAGYGGSGGAADEGMPALIWGIVAIVVCQLVGPVAWYLGHKSRAEARRAGREPPGAATAGGILGIISTLLLLVIGCFVAAAVGLGVAQEM